MENIREKHNDARKAFAHLKIDTNDTKRSRGLST
jgi:hypothetical protein